MLPLWLQKFAPGRTVYPVVVDLMSGGVSEEQTQIIKNIQLTTRPSAPSASSSSHMPSDT